METINNIEINNDSGFLTNLEWLIDEIGDFIIDRNIDRENQIILMYNELKKYLDNCIPLNFEEMKDKKETTEFLEDVFYNFNLAIPMR